MNFRSHVTLSTELGLQRSATISSGNGGCETEVSNLEIEYLIEEDVLWFEISVCHTFLMHVVKTFDQLSEIKSCNGFVESSSSSNVVEKFSTGS